MGLLWNNQTFVQRLRMDIQSFVLIQRKLVENITEVKF